MRVQGREFRSQLFVWLTALGAWFSLAVVLQLNVARTADEYSVIPLRMVVAVVVACILTGLCVVGLGVFLADRGIRKEDVRAKIALCHSPLYLSWLGLFDWSLPVFGNFQTLVVFVVFVLTAPTFYWAVFDPDVTSIASVFRRLLAFFREHPAGCRGVQSGPKFLVPLLCLLLLVAYGERYGNLPHDNGCEFGGDVWEYQSIAVNYARGHGFPIFGGLEPFEAYSFGHDQDKKFPDLVKRFYNEATPNRPVFYRAPGYTFFLGTIYKHFGVSPRIAKQVQTWLLITVAAFLPLLGWMCWRGSGVVGGILAGCLFLHVYHQLGGLLITENLLVFLAFLFVLVFLFWERKTNFATSVCLGIVLAGCMLTKGWFYPLVPMVAIFGLARIRKGLMRWPHLLTVFAVMVLLILPWSVYATVSSGRLTFICTQAAIDMPNSHNEKVLETGNWEPQATKAPGSFYQRPDIQRFPWPVQIAMFYVKHARSVPLMLLRKFRRSYAALPFFRLALMLVCFEVAWKVINHLYRRTAMERRTEVVRLLAGVLLWIAGFEILFGVFFGTNLFSWLRGEIGCLLAFSIPFVVLAVAVRGVQNITGLHPGLVIIVLNSVAITLLYYGYDRFIWPVDPFFMLIAMRYAVSFAWRIPLLLAQIWNWRNGVVA